MVEGSGREPTTPKWFATLSGESVELETDVWIARLATFPEQNPNPVIETDEGGAVTYLNPAAEATFPELREQGAEHPLLSGLTAIVGTLREAEHDYVEREVDLGDAVFEERICYTALPVGAVVRVYAHDVTARRRAEQAIHEVARRVMLAQEEERGRVSRELHDEAGQALAALKISLQLIQSETDLAVLRRGLVDAITLVEQTREQIRLLAQGLRPSVLDALDLSAALEDFCRDFARRTDLQITYRGAVLPEPSDAVRICLYRFLQEALTNVAVHSEASCVDVFLDSSNGSVRLEVRDNGKGMSPAVLKQPGRPGLGLTGMRERIELLSGSLEIDSEPGRGTSLVAVLPEGAS